jgi:UDP-2-acetamido-3-amino-2,3-dideoxy-glucuronate N-acetyltransferase
MSQTNIAVIGSGYWGKNLVRNFSQLNALHTICDSNEQLLEHLKKQHPEARTCLAFNEILSNDEISGIAIATPAETHHALAKEALLAGKNVFVEKPLTLEESSAKELIALAEKHNRTLMVGHLLHYHPVFIALKAMAKSGELGRINYIYSNRLNLGKIRREENILWSFAPHDISMILSLAQEMPISVTATGGNYLHKEIADVTTTHLEFPSGMQAHIFVSWLHPFKEQKLVVVGDKKMAVFDDTKPWNEKLLLYPHQIHWEGNVPVPEKANAERVNIPEAEPLKAECQHFLDCITNENPPLTDGKEGLRVLKVLKEAQLSMDNHGKKVSTATSAPNAFVHESAVIDENTTIGDGSAVWHFSHILKDSTLGKNCKIGQNVTIGPEVSIGNNCKIQNNVSVYKGVTLEEDVFCGPSMVFTNVYNPRCHIPRMSELSETLVKKGATLGANSTIVCGNTIGSYAFVGAGSVVTKDVPDYALVVGNPARQIGWMCSCGIKLQADLTCPSCNAGYNKTALGLKPA